MNAWMAFFALGAVGAVHAQEVASTQAELGVTHESLSGGRADWRSVYVEILRRQPDRTSFSALVRRTSRFDQTDSEVGLGASTIPAPQWTVAVDGTFSDTYRVLPHGSLGVSVGRSFEHGFALGVGLKRSEYRLEDTWLASATGERYWDNFRAALTLYGARLNEGGTAGSQRVAFDVFYADRSRAGLSLARGRELEANGSGGVIVSKVRAGAVTGTHWMNQQWAVSWEVGWHEQGDLYRRTGIRVGLRREL